MSQGILKKANNHNKFENGTSKPVPRTAFSTLAATTDVYLPK